MGQKISVLVDTDIFIDYFNHRLFRELFEGGDFRVYYSVVTKKELLSKEGLSRSENQAIRAFLKKNCRLMTLNQVILERYSALLRENPLIGREDSLIAVTAMTKNLPLVTRNYKHTLSFRGLRLWFLKRD